MRKSYSSHVYYSPPPSFYTCIVHVSRQAKFVQVSALTSVQVPALLLYLCKYPHLHLCKYRKLHPCKSCTLYICASVHVLHSTVHLCTPARFLFLCKSCTPASVQDYRLHLCKHVQGICLGSVSHILGLAIVG
jgi:hypothetical protein